jgi:hypothetical protein
MSGRGLRVTDTATGLYEDPKVKRLWRLLKGEPEASSRMATAMCLYEVVRLQSASQGEPVCALDAAPIWMDGVEEAQASLIQAGLLDDQGCIPPQAYDHWIGRAVERVETLRERGRKGGTVTQASRRSPQTPLGVPDLTSPVPPSPESARPPALATALAGGPPTLHTLSTGDGTTEHLDAYWNLTGTFPTGRSQEWLDELMGTYGMEAVSKALGAEAEAGGTGKTFLSRTQSRLAAEKTRQDRAQERAAQEAKRKADQEERARLESMPLEQRQANLARLRGLMAEKGIVKPMPGKGKPT